MVDFTQQRSGNGFGIFLGAVFVLAIVLYALYAGGDAGTTTYDPAAATLPSNPNAVAPSTTVLD